MNIRQQKEYVSKRQDRLVAFFDAVVAIAITMLALEIVIPALSSGDPAELTAFSRALTGYLISFISLAALWYLHARYIPMFGLTGGSGEVTLHFLMMFLITLFQPATRALNQYRGDRRVQLLYLGIFLGMNLINLLLMCLLRKRNERLDREEHDLRERLTALRGPTVEADLPAERLARLVAYYVHMPDTALARYMDDMTEEQLEELRVFQEERNARYRYIIAASVSVMVSVTASVIAMMFNLTLCYLCLAAGLVIAALLRIRELHRIRRKQREA